MNTIQNINLSKLNKCDQVWEEMRPCDGGKICQKCNHLIRDFRQATNEEIARAHAFSEGRVCGLYTEEQLRLRLPSKKSTWKSFYIGLLGLLYSNQVNAQEISKPPEVEQTEKKYAGNSQVVDNKKAQEATGKHDSIIIHGRMLDEKGEPIIYGSVLIKESELGTTTDIFGNYLLDAGEEFERNSQITLVYHSLGYKAKHIDLVKENVSNFEELNIALEIDELSMSRFYITVQKEPLPKRIWYRAKHLFWNGNRKHK